MLLRIFYSDRYTVELPEGHRFPMEKYRLVRMGLLSEGIVRQEELFEPAPARREAVILAHTPEYFDAIYNGTIDPKAMRKIGFPWSRSLVERSLASVGGALCAAEEALQNGASGNLAGGTHHALADSGEGFCVFNDIAVVILYLLERGSIGSAAIIDLDVHQGNGNSAILGSRKDVFILSMHGEKNYPFRKVPSTLDIDLPDGTQDEEYLFHLRRALGAVFDFRPDIVFYQAGVDPLKEDVLGRLSLTMAGLAERDRLVLSECKRREVPVSLALGGGYAKPIELTVDAHIQTYRMLKGIF
jgi:acetoin utilization deacetylase AcuC-like enzyme